MVTGKQLLAVLAASHVATAAPPDGYHPVIFSGPMLVQPLQVNDKTSTVCNTHGEFKGLWLGDDMPHTQTDLLKHPHYINCLTEGLRLRGFSDENRSVLPDDIEVRTTPGHTVLTMFGGRILPALEKEGYKEGESLTSHTYDWRLSVKDWEATTFPELRTTVEDMVKKAGGSKAVMTGVSMAGPYTHAFLTWARSKDETWTDRYIHAFVPVGGPFNGAVMALFATVSSMLGTYNQEGECPNCKPRPAIKNTTSDDIISQFLHGITGIIMKQVDEAMGRMGWSWPMLYWMSTGIDYSQDPPIDQEVITMQHGKTPPQCLEGMTSARCGAVATREGWYFDNETYLGPTECAECHKKSNTEKCKEGFQLVDDNWLTDLCCKKHKCDASPYKASQLPQMLKRMGRDDGKRMFEYGHGRSVSTTKDPGVPVHCIFGYNLKTHSHIVFTEDVLNPVAQVVLDDGDQTVDRKSLEVCTRWKSTVKVYKIPGMKHGTALGCDQVVDIVKAIALNDEAYWKAWKEPQYKDVRGPNGTVGKVEELFIQPSTSFMSDLFDSLSDVVGQMRSMISPMSGKKASSGVVVQYV